MNKNELKKVMKYCKDVTFKYDEFAVLSGDLADMLHDSPSYYIYTDIRHVAALVKWQAMQLNGEWDIKALNEVFEWMKYRVMITDIRAEPPAPTRKASSADFSNEYSDRRFSSVEI